MSEHTKRITVRLTPRLDKASRKAAADRGVTHNAFIRQAIMREVAHNNNAKAQEAHRRREAEKASES